MIPPYWFRLFPRQSSSSDSRPEGLAQGLLILAAFPLMIGGALTAGAYAARLSPWLAIPGGFIGLMVTIGLLANGGVLCGIVEAICYSGIAFVWSGGIETSDHRPAWIPAAIVAALFLFATYSVWRKNR
jgi:hypothetical protein